MDYSNYSELMGFYDELPLWSAPFGLKLLDYIDYRKNLTVLDIGFGAGFPLIEVAMRLGESSMVYGIDPSTECHSRVESKITFFGIGNIRLIKGVAESIPLNNESADLIVSNNGINNVSNINTVLSECRRILKPGGQFIMTMNLDKSMFEFYSAMESVLKEMHLDSEIVQMQLHIAEKRKPLGEVVELIHKNGFVIRDLEHDQFNYRFTDASAMLNHSFIKLAFKNAWMNICPANQRAEVFAKIEMLLNEKARINNGLSLSIPFVMINAGIVC